MKPTSVHFFSSRQEGVNLSDPKASWRFGRGNVFATDKNPHEQANATQNILTILQNHHFTELAHPGVILSSQYDSEIIKVTAATLKDSTAQRDELGLITLKADGLFTTLENVPLLNRSGDAHAIIFEAPGAIGVIVGSWRGLSKGLLDKMLDRFNSQGIPNNLITVRLGPGLGADSYSMGMPAFTELQKGMGDWILAAVKAKQTKAGEPKVVINMPKLLELYQQQLINKFQLDTSESHNTFNKTIWKQVKAQAQQTQALSAPIEAYAQSNFFSARRYARSTRLIKRIAETARLQLPEVLADSSYDNTGRNLNGVLIKAPGRSS